ncbi:uncharacterized protein [Heterodontus francisci]|uniref:uncharacterized protein isoform X1 n=1 Tax=Heterodontus francisci TaxID=7792 RepID=UPI00355BF45F
MKFYHGRPKNSFKEQRESVKDLIVAFFFVTFLSSCLACNFGNFKPHTTTYDQKIKNLRTHLPTDYNLTVFLQNPASLDSCCIELQAMLSLNQSIGHLYRHSMGTLQQLTTSVLRELRFLKDCPVRESFNCEKARWNSSHLLQNLMERLQSFDTKFNKKKCTFEQCTLYTCVTGHIETTLSTVTDVTSASTEEPGNFANGTDSPTTNATLTTIGNATNPSPTLTHINLTSLTNETNPSPSLTNGSLTGLTNRTNTGPTLINGSLATATNWTNASPTSLNNDSDGIMAATVRCNIECSQFASALAPQTAAIIIVVSVLFNMLLLGFLLKRNRQPVSSHVTEMEPLSLAGVEVMEKGS